MKNCQSLAYLFAALAVLLSNVMCAAVAYGYCDMQWGIRYGGCSAPASVAFLLCIPYGAGTVICAGAAWFFHRKYRTSL